MSRGRYVTREQVLEIRRRVAAGASHGAAALATGISRSCVCKWVGHDRLPAVTTQTKAEIAQRKAEACEMKRADPMLGAIACAGRLGVHQTTVTVWWQEAGLMPERLGQPDAPPDPFIDLLEVEYRDVDVTDEWRRVGLRRWAYVPPRPMVMPAMSSCGWMA